MLAAAIVLALIGTAFILPGRIITHRDPPNPWTTAVPRRRSRPRVVLGIANKAPGYGWSLAQAMRAWNRSGVRIRFKYVPADEAQITVTIAPDACGSDPRALACTELGHPRGEHRTIWIVRPVGRYDEARVLVHELGHILGLGHDPSGCVAMTPTLWQNCPPAPAGEWHCQLLAGADIGHAVSLYGGRTQASPRVFCPEKRRA